jgi:hypothetical protein
MEMAGAMMKPVSSPGAEPPDRIEWVPEGDGGTVTVAVQEPAALAVIAEAMTVWSKVSRTSLWFAPKPAPVTVICVLGDPRSTEREMAGPMVKDASSTGAEPPERTA